MVGSYKMMKKMLHITSAKHWHFKYNEFAAINCDIQNDDNKNVFFEKFTSLQI